MKTRLISLMIASIMAVSVGSSLNASAISVVGEKEKLEDSMNEQYTNVSELLETFKQIDQISGNISGNLWISEKLSKNFDGAYFYAEEVIDDHIGFSFSKKADEQPDIPAILKERIGYDGKFTIKEFADDYDGTLRININFLTDEHDLNYMIAEKAYSILQDYSLKSYYSSFGQVNILNYRVSMQNAPTKTFDELYSLTEEDFENYNNLLEENGIRVRYLYSPTIIEHEADGTVVHTAKKYASFPDDMTLKEKLDYILFVQEKFGHSPSVYSQMSSSGAGNSGKLIAKENNWFDGDANLDGKLTVADAAAILQYLSNADKYGLSEQAIFNADSDGNGLTTVDVINIQKQIANI